MEPGRRVARQLRLGGVEAELGQQRHHVGLGIEEARPPRPSRTNGVRRPSSGAAPARTPEAAMYWSFGRVAAIGLSHLEQGEIGEAAIAVAAARQRAGPAAGSAASTTSRVEIGLASSSASCPPPKYARRAARDERPRDGLDEPAAGERAPGAAHAALALGEHGASDTAASAASAPTAPCRGRRCARPPRPDRRRHGCPAASSAPSPSRLRPCPRRRSRALERGADLLLLQPDAAELLDLRRARNRSRSWPRAAHPRPCACDGVPPATSIIMAVARSRPGRMNAGSTPRSKR